MSGHLSADLQKLIDDRLARLDQQSNNINSTAKIDSFSQYQPKTIDFNMNNTIDFTNMSNNYNLGQNYFNSNEHLSSILKDFKSDQTDNTSQTTPYQDYISSYGGVEISSEDGTPTWTPHDVTKEGYKFDKSDPSSVGSMQQFLSYTTNPDTNLPYYSGGIDLKWGEGSQSGYDAYQQHQLKSPTSTTTSVDQDADKAIIDSQTVATANDANAGDQGSSQYGPSSWEIPKLGSTNEQGQKTVWNFPIANTLINAYRNITGTQPLKNEGSAEDPNLLGDAISNEKSSDLEGSGTNDLEKEAEEVKSTKAKRETPFDAFKWDKPTYSSWD